MTSFVSKTVENLLNIEILENKDNDETRELEISGKLNNDNVMELIGNMNIFFARKLNIISKL